MAKRMIVQAVLNFFSRFAPLNLGTFVTLGGEGLEADLWRDAGIPPEHGFLIERNRERSLRLLRTSQYRYSSSLRQFPDRLREIRGKKAAIDGLHVDLCGTIEPSMDAVRPLMPLVAASRGKCFCLTVADARRNLSLEDPTFVRRRSGELFGYEFAVAMERRLAESLSLVPRPENLPQFMQPADPDKGALREMGAMLCIFDLAAGCKPALHIDHMERYIFRSRWSGRPFRMRSYLIRLTNETPGTHEAYAEAFARRWMQSSLYFIKDAGTIRVVKEEAMKLSFSNLRRIAEAVGGAALEEFNKLVAAAESTVSELAAQRSRVLAALNGAAAAPEPTATETESKPSKAVNGTSMDVQLMLLRAAAAGPKQLRKAYEQAFKLLGIERRRNRRRTVGAFFARTQKRFRGDFVGRALDRLADAREKEALLSELAKLYSAASGKTVDVRTLAEEVKQAR